MALDFWMKAATSRLRVVISLLIADYLERTWRLDQTAIFQFFQVIFARLKFCDGCGHCVLGSLTLVIGVDYLEQLAAAKLSGVEVSCLHYTHFHYLYIYCYCRVALATLKCGSLPAGFARFYALPLYVSSCATHVAFNATTFSSTTQAIEVHNTPLQRGSKCHSKYYSTWCCFSTCSIVIAKVARVCDDEVIVQ